MYDVLESKREIFDKLSIKYVLKKYWFLILNNIYHSNKKLNMICLDCGKGDDQYLLQTSVGFSAGNLQSEYESPV